MAQRVPYLYIRSLRQIVFAIMFAVASLFAHIWEVSSDAILHCYCIDEELERKSGGTAKHLPDKLRSALSEAKEKLIKKKERAATAEIYL